MPPIVDLVSLVGGLVLLAIAGDMLVNGAATLARRAGVSALFAGIVIVGFGTSAPEMIISADAAYQGNEDIAFGNIVGSNIANILLALGLPALFAAVPLRGAGLKRTLLVCALATIAWIVVLSTGPITPEIGMLFLAGLAAYVITAYFVSRAEVKAGLYAAEALELPPLLPLGRALLFVLIGIIGLPIAAHLLLDGASKVAEFYGISHRIIGLTLLAVGTSLPELAAAIAAALRKQGDMIIGNVLGSNIFNILGAGGVVGLFGPFSAGRDFIQYDHWWLGASLALIAIGILAKFRMAILGGILFLLIYALYIVGLVEAWNLLGLFYDLTGINLLPAGETV